MINAILVECADCGCLSVALEGSSKHTNIPGTGILDCLHLCTARPFDVLSVDRLVHLALSTLLRQSALDAEPRALAYRVQERLSVPVKFRTMSGIPYALSDGYNVSEAGLAAARILASAAGKKAEPSDAFYWSAAARIMRRRLSDHVG